MSLHILWYQNGNGDVLWECRKNTACFGKFIFTKLNYLMLEGRVRGGRWEGLHTTCSQQESDVVRLKLHKNTNALV